MVEASLLAIDLDHPRGDVFNIACGERISLNEVIRSRRLGAGWRPSVTYDVAMPWRIRRATRRSLRLAAGAARRAARALGHLEARLATPELVALEQYEGIRHAMGHHDMIADPDQAYYRERYWRWIQRALDEDGADLSSSFLDAGCGPGRLLVPLAAKLSTHGGKVTGVDFLPEAITAARANVAASGLENVELHEADLLEFLRAQAEGAFSCALFLEVGLVLRDLTAVLDELGRVVRPGGLLLASFKPRYYWALTAAMRQDWHLAELVINGQGGQVPGRGWQNWHSADEVAQLLRDSGFANISLLGIGACSGVSYDPLAAIAQPSRLGAGGAELLVAIEEAIGHSNPDVGRYILAKASRP